MSNDHEKEKGEKKGDQLIVQMVYHSLERLGWGVAPPTIKSNKIQRGWLVSILFSYALADREVFSTADTATGTKIAQENQKREHKSFENPVQASGINQWLTHSLV